MCEYLRSNHICLVEKNKSFIAVALVRTVTGVALKDSFLDLSFWSPG